MDSSIRVTPLKITSQKQAASLFTAAGVSPQGTAILSAKSVFYCFQITGIKSWAANIIKQHLLSLGSDAGVERSALVRDIQTQAIVFGSLAQLSRLADKLAGQPFGLSQVAQDLTAAISGLSRDEYVFGCRDKTLKLGSPAVCGIINVTPDSFSGDGLMAKMVDGSQQMVDAGLRKAEEMVKAGAKMLDIGAESSRPFSSRLAAKEEIKRLRPVLAAVRRAFPRIILSVDTYKYETARAACDSGADVINDITAFGDRRMVSLIKRHGLGCVIMHMKGVPANMQAAPVYADVIAEIYDYLKKRLRAAKLAGIPASRVMIDPGIGFGKNVRDNFAIIQQLAVFRTLGCPVFLGVSRKSFIGKILEVPAGSRLAGSLAAGLAAVVSGAKVLRVHDVKATVQALKIFGSCNV